MKVQALSSRSPQQSVSKSLLVCLLYSYCICGTTSLISLPYGEVFYTILKTHGRRRRSSRLWWRHRRELYRPSLAPSYYYYPCCSYSLLSLFSRGVGPSFPFSCWGSNREASNDTTQLVYIYLPTHSYCHHLLLYFKFLCPSLITITSQKKNAF